MTEEVAALELRLQATLAKFQKQMDKAQRAFNKSASGVERRANKLDKRLNRIGADFGKSFERRALNALSIAAAAAAINRLGRAARTAASDMAALGDAADRASIDPAVFEQLKAAITLDGQDASGLEKGLITLSRRIVEAEQGSRTAILAFEALGVNIEKIRSQGGGTEEVLNAVADGMSRSRDKTEALNASMVLFGRAGGTMNAVLQKGSDALAVQFAEAEALGLLYGGDLLRNSQALNAQLDIQSQIIDTKLNKAFVALGPLVEDATSLFADFADTVGRGYVRLLSFIGLQRGPVSQQLARNIGELREVQDQLSDMARGGRPLRPESQGAFDQRLAELQRQESALVSRNQELNAAMQALNTPAATVPALPELPGVPRGGGRRSGGSRATSAPTIDREGEQLLQQMRERLRVLRQEQQMIGVSERRREALAAAFERERLERELLAAAQREGSTLTTEDIILAQNMAAAIEDQTVAIFDQKAALEEQAEATRKSAEQQERLARELSDVASNMISAVQGADSFKDALKRIGLQLLELAANAAFGQGPLGGLFNDLIGVGANGLVGLFTSAAPASSPIPVPRPSARGNVFSRGNITPFAKGGIVNGPATFPMPRGVGLMGEKGKEAIMPLQRTGDGRLGVAASGGAGPVTVAPVYQISGLGLSAAEVAALIQNNNKRMPELLRDALRRGK